MNIRPILTGTDWETVAAALKEELDEANEYISNERDWSYWHGYDDAKAWAWLWFLLFFATVCALIIVMAVNW